MFTASYIILWTLILTMSVYVLRMKNHNLNSSKPFGLIRADFGVPLGQLFPVRNFNTISGIDVDVHNDFKRKKILLITSPSCDSCKELYPAIQPFSITYGDKYQVISIMYGERDEIEQVRLEQNLSIPIIQMNLDDLKEIQTEMFPFGYLLSADGKVISKGVVGNSEQLELLRTWRPDNSKVA